MQADVLCIEIHRMVVLKKFGMHSSAVILNQIILAALDM